VADVSAILRGSRTDWEILWEMSLTDGLTYQAESWIREGMRLRRIAPKGRISASKYFR
jgi:hypothetical protein